MVVCSADVIIYVVWWVYCFVDGDSFCLKVMFVEMPTGGLLSSLGEGMGVISVILLY